VRSVCVRRGGKTINMAGCADLHTADTHICTHTGRTHTLEADQYSQPHTHTHRGAFFVSPSLFIHHLLHSPNSPHSLLLLIASLTTDFHPTPTMARKRAPTPLPAKQPTPAETPTSSRASSPESAPASQLSSLHIPDTQEREEEDREAKEKWREFLQSTSPCHQLSPECSVADACRAGGWQG